MTPEDFLGTLPDTERSALSLLRELITDNAPGLTERMGGTDKHRMLVYGSAKHEFVAALAAGKSHMSLHFLPLYYSSALSDKYRAKLQGVKMGKACINFKKIDKLPLDAIAEMIREGVKCFEERMEN